MIKLEMDVLRHFEFCLKMSKTMITTYSSFGFDTLHLYSCGLSNGFLAPQFTPNGSVKSGHDGHGQKICENHKTHVITEKKKKQGDY